MFRFGVECMMTDRYDTYVPYRLMHILQNIDQDRDSDFGVYAIPEVKVAVRQLLNKMSEKMPGLDERDYYLSLLAAIAWRNGDYRESAGVMDRLGPKLDPGSFDEVRGWAPLAVSQVRAMNTPHARAIAAADKLLEDEKYDDAIQACRDVAAKLPKDHPGLFYVHYRARDIEIERELQAGKWVSLAPGEDLVPWAVLNGNWKLDKDGAIVGASDARGEALLQCRRDFGPAYEVKATIDAPDAGKLPLAKIYVEHFQHNRWASGGVDFQSNRAHATAAWTRAKEPFEGKEATMSIQVKDGLFGVSVNGKPVTAGQRLDTQTPDDGAFIVLGISTTGPGVARFRDVQIRRIDANQN
jgi:hypothetical protein